ncbi:PHP domain-containing protein, partial [Candidatus Pacearchaeota archaeon]|nr:PHP domain-containing protein [Candidatus Pacearchaeota archaeon]
PKVIGYDSLRGDLQIQTDWTDGSNSIEEMTREAVKQGLEYIAITDHTKDLAMTGGSDEKKLLNQMKEIDRINKKISGIKILKGAEVNIRKDGSLDIKDEVLAKLDAVGISVHSNFKMTKKDMANAAIALRFFLEVSWPSCFSVPSTFVFSNMANTIVKTRRKGNTTS